MHLAALVDRVYRFHGYGVLLFETTRFNVRIYRLIDWRLEISRRDSLLFPFSGKKESLEFLGLEFICYSF